MLTALRRDSGMNTLSVLEAILDDLAERVAVKMREGSTLAANPGAAQRARLVSIEEAA